jgi:dienelactone hydrolase
MMKIISLVLAVVAFAAHAAPSTVYFPSRDGTTEVVGYLFEPSTPGRHPAIVMLHGRAGPYSSNVNANCTDVGRGKSSPCNASTLSKRHEQWGEYWASRGYVAMLVDSFGPRGRGHGYGRGTHDDADRDDVNERTVRPLDADGGLAFLASRSEVDASRIFLQGWSNGGSTTLNAMYRQAREPHSPRFRAALAFYPGCGPKALISQRYVADARIWVFLASDDEEVSPKTCADVLSRATPAGLIDVTTYPGATHDFDDPGKTRQAVAGNRAARADAMQKAASLVGSAP